MFMVCWYYCIPFLSFLILAIAPILGGVGVFVMKRGILQYKQNLKERAFLIWVVALAKFIIIDIPFMVQSWLCLPLGACSGSIQILKYATMGASAAVSAWILIQLYKKYIPHREDYRPVQKNLAPLKMWTGLSVGMVSLFVVWVMGPWVTSLTMGHISHIFLMISWHYIAILASFCLLMAFWRLEEFQWYYVSTKSKAERKKDVWVPKDTLWTLVFIHGLALLLAFASSSMIAEVMQSIRD